jgi:hypothetical protein
MWGVTFSTVNAGGDMKFIGTKISQGFRKACLRRKPLQFCCQLAIQECAHARGVRLHTNA